jgi:hypothetical protein
MRVARYITALCSAGLTFLVRGFVQGQHTAPTDHHLVSEDVLATIDLAKEIDGVQNRELRLSRAVVLPDGILVCTAIKAIPRSSTCSPGSSPITMTMERQRSLVPARYSPNLARERTGSKTRVLHQ